MQLPRRFVEKLNPSKSIHDVATEAVDSSANLSNKMAPAISPGCEALHIEVQSTHSPIKLLIWSPPGTSLSPHANHLFSLVTNLTSSQRKFPIFEADSNVNLVVEATISLTHPPQPALQPRSNALPMINLFELTVALRRASDVVRMWRSSAHELDV